MVEGLLGKKVGMTHVFDESGRMVPVTVIEAGPCVILQVKTAERDGYAALQLGFDDQKPHRANQPETGLLKKIEKQTKKKVLPKRFVREVRGEDLSGYNPGDRLAVADVFEDVQKVDVSGVSKGRGFAGTIRRWKFSGGPVTHGSKNIREPGSIGMSATPSRVLKGKRMSGQYGNKNRTARNLELVKVDSDRNVLLVKGGVPGPNGGYVVIRKSLGG